MEHYTLHRYAALLYEEGLCREADLKGKDETEVKGLSYDSKESGKDFLFICKGAAFKEAYLNDVVEQGVLAYVSEKDYHIEGVPCLLVSDVRRTMPVLADLYFNSPQDKMILVGVGGTKGKTSTSCYIKSILDERAEALGEPKCGIWASTHHFDGKVEEESHITTPESVELYRFLARAVENGVRYFVAEVSSQALKYHRVEGLRFNVGILLNISEDHISPIEHSDFEDYFNSKLLMFDQTENAVVNLDSDCIDRMLVRARAAGTMTTISLSDSTADYHAETIRSTRSGSEFIVDGEHYETALLGKFNVENALAAIAAAKILGIGQAFITQGISLTKVEGRMEVYRSADDRIIGIVDYAHNKLSFEKLFSSLRQEFRGYRIVAIFGAPGGKALQRREELGTVVAGYADDIFLTAEDPGFERVVDICTEIGSYVEKQNRSYEIFEERGEAIRVAVENAREKTLVVMTGKGNETFQKVEGRYDDTLSDGEYIIQYLEKYDGRND